MVALTDFVNIRHPVIMPVGDIVRTMPNSADLLERVVSDAVSFDSLRLNLPMKWRRWELNPSDLPRIIGL